MSRAASPCLCRRISNASVRRPAGGGALLPPALFAGRSAIDRGEARGKAHASLRLSLSRLRAVHVDAADGGMRSAPRMSAMPEGGAARVPDRALLRNDVGRAPIGARDQRAQRIRAEASLRREGAWRGMRLLRGKIVAHHQAWQERYEKLPHEPTLDDLALGRAAGNPKGPSQAPCRPRHSGAWPSGKRFLARRQGTSSLFR